MLVFFPKPEGDEERIRQIVRRLVAEHVRPFAVEDDETERFRREVFAEIAKLGLHRLSVPKEYGGEGLSSRCYYACLEELARASVAWSVTLGVTNLIHGALVKYGSDPQKRDLLARLVKGEWIGAFSLSEPGSGSDASSLKLAARKVDGGYSLNGTKVWCSTAGKADLYLVMGRTGEHRTKGISAFLVPAATRGFRIGKQEKKLGLRASPLAELIFENCFVTEAQRLGQEGDGLAVALSQLDSGRISIGSAGLGVAIEAIERCWRYLASREQAAKGEFQDFARRSLAEHYATASALRTLITQAARMRDTQLPITTVASQVKLLGSDLAVRVSGDAIALMGEAGVTRELEVERLWRDAKALQIVEGTNQIQKIVLARQVEEMIGNGRTESNA